MKKKPEPCQNCKKCEQMIRQMIKQTVREEFDRLNLPDQSLAEFLLKK